MYFEPVCQSLLAVKKTPAFFIEINSISYNQRRKKGKSYNDQKRNVKLLEQ